MQSNWEQAFKQMLASEGGFTDDERDKGNKLPDGRKGSTMLGVTQFNWENHIGHQVTHEQMRKLTAADVEPLYKKKYWDVVRADELPSGIDYLVFDVKGECLDSLSHICCGDMMIYPGGKKS
jgi:lysozyme family protein